jgi:hypothetical protein
MTIVYTDPKYILKVMFYKQNFIIKYLWNFWVYALALLINYQKWLIIKTQFFKDCFYEACTESKDTKVLNLIFKSNTVKELLVYNFIFQHSRRHCPNIY